MKIFIIPGYHLPKNVSSDEIYQRYFEFACFEIKKISQDEKVLVILSGGNIDMDKPYDRILSKEMNPLFELIANRYNLSYSIITEERSLSSIENLVYSKEIIDSVLGDNEVYIFSDQQRAKRTMLTADKVFKKFTLLTIDLSSEEERKNNEIVERKEDLAIKFSLWALENKENFEEFKNVYIDKFKILREAPPKNRKAVEIEWWKKMISKNQDKVTS